MADRRVKCEVCQHGFVPRAPVARDPETLAGVGVTYCSRACMLQLALLPAAVNAPPISIR